MTQEQWKAIQTRDVSFDGRFVYVRKTRGVICRPSCRIKHCSPENVIVYDSMEQAVTAGYQPCQYCCPHIADWAGTKGELAKKLCEWLENHYEEKYSLDSIADAMHMDKNYLLRVFKEVTGSTMLHYHNAVRCRHASELLRRPELSISFIGASVGFKTPAHFTRIFKETMGTTPAEYRKTILRLSKNSGQLISEHSAAI